MPRNRQLSQKRVLLLRNVSADAFSFHPRLPQVIAKISLEAVATWNLENGQELTRFPLAGRAIRLSFSPKGDRFAALVWPGGKFEVHDATNPEAPALVSRSRPFSFIIKISRWRIKNRCNGFCS